MGTQVASYERVVSVTPSDTTELGCEGFIAGGAGNVAVVPKRGGSAVTITAVIVGQVYPIACNKIMSTNTTATNIVALY